MNTNVRDFPSSNEGLPSSYSPDPVLLAIIDVIRDGLIRDQHVRLQDFGTFRLHWASPRKTVNKKTGEVITHSPVPKITFTPAKCLKELIEPNPKPVIPLNEIQESSQEESSSEDNAGYSVTRIFSDEKPANDETEPFDLRENIQHTLDEQFGSQTIQKGRASTINRKWAIGLLAAMPFIIWSLQSHFLSDNEQPDASVSSTVIQEQLVEPGPGPSALNSNTDSLVAPADSEISIEDPVKQQGAGDIQAEPVAPLQEAPPQATVQASSSSTNINSVQPAAETESTTSIETSIDSVSNTSPSDDPAIKSFYMNPLVYRIQENDNLWNLAREFYGDPLLWPHIYRANARTLSDPDRIIVGKQLVIPGLQNNPEQLSDNDKALVAEGYYMLYEFYASVDKQKSTQYLRGAGYFSPEWLKENDV